MSMTSVAATNMFRSSGLEQTPTLAQLRARYRRVRGATESLAAPLSAEDCGTQSMPDVSPTKWHLAHTTWFFETFVLARASTDYQPVDPTYALLFNSYYNTVGNQHPRPERGLLTRPSLDTITQYRTTVDARIDGLLRLGRCSDELAALIALGLHHEQQHQELLLTDIKHVFSRNPLHPKYNDAAPDCRPEVPMGFVAFDAGVFPVGHGGGDFCFDNELPRHRVFLERFELGTRLVSCGDYLAFMRDDGYRRHELWLSDGWSWLQQNDVRAPLYWVERDGSWQQHTLQGLRAVAPAEPVVHVSLFEADAYARWAGARLPRESELEIAYGATPIGGNFVETGALHPAAAETGRAGLQQLYGDTWEWTQSSYSAYPGYKPAAGALGEYNGKFMCNQYVLRGGSCATPRSHMRASYRNFFPTHTRWQFTGLRLARDS
jgi:ergothioneine biosynthesis protein EgtB